MITEDYISFETAKLLKEKGFDWGCKRMFRVLKSSTPKVYDYPEWVTNQDLCDLYQNCEFAVIPTLQMAMKWLREVHNLHIMVDCIGAKNYMPTIQFTRNSKDIEIKSKTSKIGGNGFDSHEEACEAAIKYCLKNLI